MMKAVLISLLFHVMAGLILWRLIPVSQGAVPGRILAVTLTAVEAAAPAGAAAGPAEEPVLPEMPAVSEVPQVPEMPVVAEEAVAEENNKEMTEYTERVDTVQNLILPAEGDSSGAPVQDVSVPGPAGPAGRQEAPGIPGMSDAPVLPETPELTPEPMPELDISWSGGRSLRLLSGEEPSLNIPPGAVLMDHVMIDFTVLEDGSVAGVRLLPPGSGNFQVDRQIREQVSLLLFEALQPGTSLCQGRLRLNLTRLERMPR